METPPSPAPQAPETRDRRVIKRFTRQDRRGLFYIVAGVVLAYGLLAYFLFSPADKVLPGRAQAADSAPNEGNFSTAGTLYLGDNGERTTVREYTVDISRMPARDTLPADTPNADEAAAARAEVIQR